MADSNTDLDTIDISALDPSAYARLVKATPDKALAALMEGERRTAVIEEIFERMVGSFRADKAGSRAAIIHWKIEGRADGGTDSYETVIENGQCTWTSTPAREPRVTVTMNGVNFLKLTSGNASGTTMFMTRRLKADGDLGLAANLTKLFDIPTP